MLDVLVRGATVFDGSGGKSFKGDVGVRDGVIVPAEAGAGRAIDAGGLALMPGIVDVHTHYDAQITWDATLSPSVGLGVTTMVMGNCGFGIALCPAPLRETLLRNLSVVEGMDVDALLAGTRWEFETFPQYLDMLERRRPLANVAVLAQHSTIRNAVMGESASTAKTPTAGQLGQMRQLVAEAMDAGAAGFASSFSPNHSGWGVHPMPSTIAGDDELRTLVKTFGEKQRRIFVIATGPRATPEFMEALAAETGRPTFIVTVLAMHNRAQPQQAMQMFERCAQAHSRGHEVYIHANCQPLSFDFTLSEPYLLYSNDAFDRVKTAPAEERASLYREPAFRNRLRHNFQHPKQGILFYGDWTQVERDGVAVTELARRGKKDPLDYVFDLPLDVQLVAKLYQNDDAGVAPLLKHPAGVVALAGAGAHPDYFFAVGLGLHFLSHSQPELGTVTLDQDLRRLTSDPARKYRIPKRGLIVPGNQADLLLFDPARVGVSGLRRVKDLPAGGTRMVRDALGLHGVWVNGVQVFDGERYTALDCGPGEVLRRFER